MPTVAGTSPSRCGRMQERRTAAEEAVYLISPPVLGSPPPTNTPPSEHYPTGPDGLRHGEGATCSDAQDVQVEPCRSSSNDGAGI
jgi:hypothetical protein